ncbi:hypothetical protein DXM27_07950 [Rhizobium rhizogenes]|uniref:Uncharacterized protein n=1 Tax=Rhizobium rhizogenes TaxID=359 RepID=A0AA88F1C8_RHIRH|nr:hypothetical protein DXM27_07950 [Rhizobium rhizogenes]MQB08356.1 hypothetical protein [Agrobacterium sp. ICMP 6402]NTZ90199.1 hypothetical protein [Agrobacterium tumefaciens]
MAAATVLFYRFFARPCLKPAALCKTALGKRGTPCKSALLFGTYRINDLLTNGRSRWLISTIADAHDAPARFRRCAGFFLIF